MRHDEKKADYVNVIPKAISVLFLIITISLVCNTAQATDYRYVPGGYVDAAAGRSDVVYVANVPDIQWYYGCAPTSAGDILAYWQTEKGQGGLGDLGDWESTIASDGHITAYYEDPISGTRGGGAAYNSTSDPHPGTHLTDDCLADYMGTSNNTDYGNTNGGTTSWTYNNDPTGSLVVSKAGDDASMGVKNYVESKGLTADVHIYRYDYFTFDDFKAEIDAGRPVVLGVDSSGNGGMDHFAVGFGYDPSSNEYLVYSEWGAYGEFYSGNSSRYETWDAVANGTDWGVGQVMTISISGGSGAGAGTPEPSSLIIMLLGCALFMPYMRKSFAKN